jgi:glycosyltransferase involved in cell wall biosynthesis
MQASVGNRVLMLLENNPYPQDARVRREAKTLTDAGYQVTIICPSDPKQPWRELVDGVRVYRYPAPPPSSGVLGYLWEYGYSMSAAFILSFFVFFRGGFDIIHAHNPPDTFVFVAALYKVIGKRFIFDHHDLSPEMYHARFKNHGHPFVYKVLLWLEKLSCRMADHVIATNESYRSIEIERGKVPQQRITIVRNGPELKNGRAIVPDRRLRELGKLIIGYVGVMGHQDGVDYLLRALFYLLNEFNRSDFLCLIIGGRGEARETLKVLSSELGLNDHVSFTGWVSDEDLFRYLSSVDICVDPDPSNAFNDRSTMIKMMEYMSVAKPIVAFDLPEHRFSAQDAALYVRPNNEIEFAAALVQLMDDPGRRQRMGAFGRRRIETELAWHHSIRNLLDAYRTLSQGAHEKV